MADRQSKHNVFKIPYWAIFEGYAKRRWVGRRITEVFCQEFAALHPLYTKAAIRKGRIFVNGKPLLTVDYRFRDNDKITHINHRHETEIPAFPIQIVAETDDFLVVNKPPGVPVHPCGNYNLHTVYGLLVQEHGVDKAKLRTLYRLDRNTTGLLMFAKHYEADAKFKNSVQKRSLGKEYVAKVRGIFPDGELVCDAPIGLLSHQMGIRCVRPEPEGQNALSRFRCLHADTGENTSIVSCQIETGRTHQIRIHLQYLGYPIVGDDFYDDEVWGPAKGKDGDYAGRSYEQLTDALLEKHSKTKWIIDADPDYEKRLVEVAENELYEAEEHHLKELDLSTMPDYDPICWNCSIRSKRVMHERNWTMPLHCWRYSGDGFSFEAPLPDWAKPAQRQLANSPRPCRGGGDQAEEKESGEPQQSPMTQTQLLSA